MYCPHCGKKVADNSKFCEFCGKEIPQLSPAEPAKPTPPTKPSTKNKASTPMSEKEKNWMYALCVLLIVGTCLVVVKYSQGSKNTETHTYSSWTSTQPSEPATEQVAEAESEEEADVVQEGEVVPEAAVASEEPELIEPAPQVSQSDYVDLGLPSGTRWKESNERGGDYEDGLYTYDDAVARFGGSLPTHAQMTELFTKCQWAWNGSGYDVTGPNGRMIRLPLTGYRESNGTPQNRGITGNYWTRDVRDVTTNPAWKLYFRSDHKEICTWRRADYHAVRLVE